MAVLRCPHCGKPNPDFLDLCQYCEKPMKAAAASAGESKDLDRLRSSSADEGDVPDWLKTLTGDLSAQAAAPAEDMPNWLDTGTSTPAEGTGEALPDWLKSLGATGAMPFPPPPPSAPTEEMPDRLPEATPAQPAIGPQPSPISAEPESTEAELPDWLRKATGPLTTELAPPPPPPVRPVEPQPAEEIPDWLKRATGMLREKPVEPAMPLPAESEGLPDWLKAATGPLTTAFAPRETTPVPPPPPDVPGLEKGELPDWLRPMTGKLPAVEPAEAPARAPTAEEARPIVSEPSPAGVTAPPLLESEPDWLVTLREVPEELAEPEAGAVPTPPADLAQAELPSWLAAMRPVDVAPTGLDRETDDYMESVGVLKGLRGVLRAEPSVVLPGKSATNVHLLNYTDAQSRQAALLTKLVTVEAPAPTAQKRLALSAWPWERWLVAALLILSLVLALPFGRDAAGQEISGPFAGLFPLPRTAALEVVRAFETINALDAARPVLVAFDYEPGQAGEMTPLADVVVGHLIRRGLPIVAISTQVTGAGVAEDRLARLTGAARGRINDYVRGVHYINLGYLPGGPLGIRQLVGAPRSLARMGLPASGNLWETAPLLGSVQSFNDFSAVIVLSHTPDGARAWVEQTQGTTPRLVLATSAGAAPLVRPYFEGDGTRIAGFLGGPAAAMQYDTLGGNVLAVEQERAGWSRRWDMLGVGLLTMAVLLIFGNLIHGVRRSLAQAWRVKAR
ncbi:MAG: hypothetical protein RMK99_04810 [Anaerolineales bacterium]|nr:hypothetical protein [Anaerolineales bacterium]